MLENQKRSAGPEHMVETLDDVLGVGNAAEHFNAYDSVHSAGGDVVVFAEVGLVLGAAALIDSLSTNVVLICWGG